MRLSNMVAMLAGNAAAQGTSSKSLVNCGFGGETVTGQVSCVKGGSTLPYTRPPTNTRPQPTTIGDCVFPGYTLPGYNSCVDGGTFVPTTTRSAATAQNPTTNPTASGSGQPTSSFTTTGSVSGNPSRSTTPAFITQGGANPVAAFNVDPRLAAAVLAGALAL